MATLGQGAVAVFSESGVLQQVLTGAGHLAAPWGIALAPSGFGQFGGDLLVGNFSYINSGLWALGFGGMGSNGDPNTLYFTDGIDGETHGLFGAISAVPEPATWAMMLLGFAGLGFAFRQSQRRVSFA